MKLKKLDKRMNGYGDFQYYVDFSTISTRTFFEAREWCIEQWGRTAEIDIWLKYNDLRNPAWSWERGESNRNYKCRVFLASDKEAHWFSLRWQ